MVSVSGWTNFGLDQNFGSKQCQKFWFRCSLKDQNTIQNTYFSHISQFFLSKNCEYLKSILLILLIFFCFLNFFCLVSGIFFCVGYGKNIAEISVTVLVNIWVSWNFGMFRFRQNFCDGRSLPAILFFIFLYREKSLSNILFSTLLFFDHSLFDLIFPSQEKFSSLMKRKVVTRSQSYKRNSSKRLNWF